MFSYSNAMCLWPKLHIANKRIRRGEEYTNKQTTVKLHVNAMQLAQNILKCATIFCYSWNC